MAKKKAAPKTLYAWWTEDGDGGFWQCSESIPTEAGRNWHDFHVYSHAGQGRARDKVESDVKMDKK